MKDELQKQVRLAIFAALKPIARMLLRTGIGYREFNEVAKSAFVDVATKDYGLRGRPTNISRVAVMTGLTRKEVKKIREQIEYGYGSVVAKSTPLGEVLHRWYSDKEFLDEMGRPHLLPFDGDTLSFTNLVKRTGGDIPPGAMRAELKRIGAIRATENGFLEPVKRNVIAEELHERVITGLVRGIGPISSTIAHNTNPAGQADTWVQRTVSTRFVSPEDVGRVRRISRDRLNEFTESIDDLYSAYESIHADQEVNGGKAKVIGIGVFYFEDDG